MKIFNTTANEMVELEYRFPNGVDSAEDIIGNAGQLHYNKAADRYEMTSDEIKWWEDYLANSQSDEEQLAELRDEYNTDPDGCGKDIISDIVADEMGDCNEMGDEHAAFARIFERIKSELPKSV